MYFESITNTIFEIIDRNIDQFACINVNRTKKILQIKYFQEYDEYNEDKQLLKILSNQNRPMYYNCSKNSADEIDKLLSTLFHTIFSYECYNYLFILFL